MRDRLLHLLRLGDRDAARRLIDDALRRDDLDTVRCALDVLGHRRAASSLFELRELTARAPSASAWQHIVRTLKSWPQSEGRDHGLQYVAARINDWPDVVRKATWAWWFDLERDGRFGQLWQLVRRFEASGTRLAVHTIAAILNTPELGWLTSLALEAARCGDRAVDEIVASPYLSGLRELELSLDEIGVAGARALADSTNLPRLERLVLGNNPLGDAGAIALAGATGLAGSLRELALAHASIGDAGAIALARGELALEGLDLSCNEVGPEGLAALLAEDASLSLWALDLSNNPLGSRGVDTLLDSARARGLRHLALDHTGLDERDVRRLATARGLAALEVLGLAGIPRTSSLVAALFDGLPSLDTIVVERGRRLSRRDRVHAASSGFNTLSAALRD